MSILQTNTFKINNLSIFNNQTLFENLATYKKQQNESTTRQWTSKHLIATRTSGQLNSKKKLETRTQERRQSVMLLAGICNNVSGICTAADLLNALLNRLLDARRAVQQTIWTEAQLTVICYLCCVVYYVWWFVCAREWSDFIDN